MSHWPTFTEFVRQEVATGGPDPQIPLLVELARGFITDRSKVWLAGCYGAHHCVPSAYMVWRHWSFEDVIEKPESFRNWLDEHWEFLPVRPEMRSHRMLDKRHRCLEDFAIYASTWDRSQMRSYDEVWADSQANVKYFGRYMAIKFLEILRRMDLTDFEMPDLRAKDAWSPRRTLAMLYPEVEVLGIREAQSVEDLHRVDLAALAARTELQARGIGVNLFQLQVLLCEYREALNAGYYPGASHDEELDYIAFVAKRWPEHMHIITDARSRVFPKAFLGEAMGWDGIRRDQYVQFKLEGRH